MLYAAVIDTRKHHFSFWIGSSKRFQTQYRLLSCYCPCLPPQTIAGNTIYFGHKSWSSSSGINLNPSWILCLIVSEDAVGFSVCVCLSNSLGIHPSVCFKERLNLLRVHTGSRIITLFQVSPIRLVVLPKILILFFACAFRVFIYISILFLPPLITICPFYVIL